MNVIPALQAFRGKRLNPVGVSVDFSLEHADGLSRPKPRPGRCHPAIYSRFFRSRRPIRARLEKDLEVYMALFCRWNASHKTGAFLTVLNRLVLCDAMQGFIAKPHTAYEEKELA
jgi:hypothetical protein